MSSMLAPVMEFRNQNALRAFPFSEAARRIDTYGRGIPDDLFVDALLAPPDGGASVLECTRINFVERRVTITAPTHGKLYTGVWEASADEVWVYEEAFPYRQAGVLVFGYGAATASGVYEFAPGALPFEPSACISLEQEGVRGFVLPDESLVAGDVEISGGPGVRVRTYSDDGVSKLRVDVIGAPQEDEDDGCLSCGLVRCLRIEGGTGSLIVPSLAPGAGGVFNQAWLTGYGFDLATLCQNPAAPNLPGEKRTTSDWCADQGSTCGDLTQSQAVAFTICPSAGVIAVTTPSSIASDNPLRITAEQRVPQNLDAYTGGLTDDIDALGKKLARARSADKQSIGVLTIGFRAGKGMPQ